MSTQSASVSVDEQCHQVARGVILTPIITESLLNLMNLADLLVMYFRHRHFSEASHLTPMTFNL